MAISDLLDSTPNKPSLQLSDLIRSIGLSEGWGVEKNSDGLSMAKYDERTKAPFGLLGDSTAHPELKRDPQAAYKFMQYKLTDPRSATYVPGLVNADGSINPDKLPQLRDKWAPVGAKNDPNRLNDNWLPNVSKYLGNPSVGQSTRSPYAGISALLDMPDAKPAVSQVSGSTGNDLFAPAPPSFVGQPEQSVPRGNSADNAPVKFAPIRNLLSDTAPSLISDVLQPGKFAGAPRSDEAAKQNAYAAGHRMPFSPRDESRPTEDEMRTTAALESDKLRGEALRDLTHGNILKGALGMLDADFEAKKSQGTVSEAIAGVMKGALSAFPLVSQGMQYEGDVFGSGITPQEKSAQLSNATHQDTQRYPSSYGKLGSEAGNLLSSLAQLGLISNAAPALSTGAAFVLPSMPGRIAKVAEAINDDRNVSDEVGKQIIGAGIQYATGNALGPAAEKGANAIPLLPRFGSAVSQGALFGASGAAEQMVEQGDIDAMEAGKSAAIGIGFGLLGHQPITDAEVKSMTEATPVPRVFAEQAKFDLTDEMLEPFKKAGAIAPEVTVETIQPELGESIKTQIVSNALADGLKETGNFRDAVYAAGDRLGISEAHLEAVLDHPDVAEFLPQINPLPEEKPIEREPVAKVGDFVNGVDADGNLTTAEPAEVLGFEEKNGQRFYRVKYQGQESYLPEDRIERVEAEQDQAVPQATENEAVQTVSPESASMTEDAQVEQRANVEQPEPTVESKRNVNADKRIIEEMHPGTVEEAILKHIAEGGSFHIDDVQRELGSNIKIGKGGDYSLSYRKVANANGVRFDDFIHNELPDIIGHDVDEIDARNKLADIVTNIKSAKEAREALADRYRKYTEQVEGAYEIAPETEIPFAKVPKNQPSLLEGEQDAAATGDNGHRDGEQYQSRTRGEDLPQNQEEVRQEESRPASDSDSLLNAPQEPEGLEDTTFIHLPTGQKVDLYNLEAHYQSNEPEAVALREFRKAIGQIQTTGKSGTDFNSAKQVAIGNLRRRSGLSRSRRAEDTDYEDFRTIYEPAIEFLRGLNAKNTRLEDWEAPVQTGVQEELPLETRTPSVQELEYDKRIDTARVEASRSKSVFEQKKAEAEKAKADGANPAEVDRTLSKYENDYNAAVGQYQSLVENKSVATAKLRATEQELFAKVPKPEETQAVSDADAVLSPSEKTVFADRPLTGIKNSLRQAFVGEEKARSLAASSEIAKEQRPMRDLSRMKWREYMAEQRREQGRAIKATAKAREIVWGIRSPEAQKAFFDFIERNPNKPTTAEDVAKLIDPFGENASLHGKDYAVVAKLFKVKPDASDLSRWTKDLNTLRDVIREANDKRFEEWSKYRFEDPTEAKKAYVENYYSHIWADQRLAADTFKRIMDRKAAEGSKQFLQKRVFEFASDAIDYGLVPKSDNLVDMFLAGHEQQLKYITAHKWFEAEREAGHLVYRSADAGPTVGLARLADTLGIVFGRRRTPVISFFDLGVRSGLESFAERNAITIKRSINPGRLPEEAGAGFSEGSDTVYIRHAAENELLTHEIGHWADKKFDLYKNLAERGVYGKATKLELERLANQRLVGHEDAPSSFREYVKSPKETVANLIHAYVHAPELLQEIAPTAKRRLEEIAARTPALQELLSIKPSVSMGSETAIVDAGGKVISGYWWAPEPIANDFNSSLTPGLEQYRWFRGARALNNTLNLTSLSLSGFHGMGTAINAAISTGELGLRELFGKGMSAGMRLEGAANIAKGITVLPAVAETYYRGRKLTKAWYEADGVNPVLSNTLQAIVKSGGDATMNAAYKTHLSDNIVRMFVRDASLSSIAKGLGSIPLNVLTKSSSAIMEHWVPALKLGTMGEMAKMRMRQDPNMNSIEFQKKLQSDWASVDNRFGQLIYDNLFWKKTAKQLAMVGVRSVGWNFGTIRELGGGVGDLTKSGFEVLKSLAGKKGNPEFTSRLGYTIMLPAMVGLWGAIANKIMTGKDPESILDLFYPKTGATTADGEAERFTLPTYMKDVMSYSKDPKRTVINKASPLFHTISEMLDNRTFYGDQIVNEDDSWKDKAEDYTKFILQQGLPFSVTGLKKELDRGRKLGSKETILPFIGITPAPKDIINTPFEQWAFEQAQANKPIGGRTKEAATKGNQDNEVRRAISEGNYDKAKDLAKKYNIVPSKFAEMNAETTKDQLSIRLKNFTPQQVIAGLKFAKEDERQRIMPILEAKITSSRTLTDDQKDELRNQFGFEKPALTPKQQLNQLKKENLSKMLGAEDEYDAAVVLKRHAEEKKQMRSGVILPKPVNPSGVVPFSIGQ